MRQRYREWVSGCWRRLKERAARNYVAGVRLEEALRTIRQVAARGQGSTLPAIGIMRRTPRRKSPGPTKRRLTGWRTRASTAPPSRPRRSPSRRSGSARWWRTPGRGACRWCSMPWRPRRPSPSIAPSTRPCLCTRSWGAHCRAAGGGACATWTGQSSAGCASASCKDSGRRGRGWARTDAKGSSRSSDALAGRARLVAVATHNVTLARESLRRLTEAGTRCELEQLLGYPLRSSLEVARQFGVPIRLYVPFGHAHLPYYVSRAAAEPWIARQLLVDDMVGPGTFAVERACWSHALHRGAASGFSCKMTP